MWISWMNAHFGIILVVNKERCLLSCHKLGTKKKFWVPMRNRTSGLQILYFNALPLSHREFMVSKVHYKVHNYMTRVLQTVCISNVNSNFKLDFLVFALFVTGTKKIQWKYTSLKPLRPKLISNYQIIELTKFILFCWFIISFNAGINSSHQMTKPRKLEVMHFNKS